MKIIKIEIELTEDERTVLGRIVQNGGDCWELPVSDCYSCPFDEPFDGCGGGDTGRLKRAEYLLSLETKKAPEINPITPCGRRAA